MMNIIKHIFKNKKAVSPLIATVLLIAFAVALGAVVMNWGRGYVEDTQDFARERSDAEIICTTDINLDVVRVDLTQQACFNDTGSRYNVSLILENSANREIQDLRVRVIGSSSRVPYFADISNNTILTAGQAKLFTFLHNDSDYGNISQIAITPIVNIAGKQIACNGNQLKLINLRSCSEIGW